jgi:hypothetical protein
MPRGRERTRRAACCWFVKPVAALAQPEEHVRINFGAAPAD